MSVFPHQSPKVVVGQSFFVLSIDRQFFLNDKKFASPFPSLSIDAESKDGCKRLGRSGDCDTDINSDSTLTVMINLRHLSLPVDDFMASSSMSLRADSNLYSGKTSRK